MLLVVPRFAEGLHEHDDHLRHRRNHQQDAQLRRRLSPHEQPQIHTDQKPGLCHTICDGLRLCDDGALHLIGPATECFGDFAGLFRPSGIHPVSYQPCRQQKHRQADADPQYLHFLG